MNYLLFGVIILFLNLPFGYWRSNTGKFSIQWVLSIHLPVPLVIALRIFSGMGWSVTSFVISIFFFFSGQFIGGKLHRFLFKKYKIKISSCLVMDTFRLLFHTKN